MSHQLAGLFGISLNLWCRYSSLFKMLSFTAAASCCCRFTRVTFIWGICKVAQFGVRSDVSFSRVFFCFFSIWFFWPFGSWTCLFCSKKQQHILALDCVAHSYLSVNHLICLIFAELICFLLLIALLLRKSNAVNRGKCTNLSFSKITQHLSHIWNLMLHRCCSLMLYG